MRSLEAIQMRMCTILPPHHLVTPYDLKIAVRVPTRLLLRSHLCDLFKLPYILYNLF
ncbi:hypothetical protein OESDEN_23729 [Oesophagostomum dentatum]|uniref:Uncharacterized protein n=1 Tax=Oesophagostomum dentatum TaxID=61180 RepID=A0A0B1RYF8_OESDE|nr:hypothetical protein OESDEN_23729 [Oesophagostomum dentatum]